MKRSHYIIWLCLSAATGSVIGMLSEQKPNAKAGFVGATAGIIAGSVAVATYEFVTSQEKVPYYSELSPLYEEI